MNYNDSNIEVLLKEKFEHAEVIPSAAVWKKLDKKLRWNRFLSFTPKAINMYYILIVAGGLTVGGLKIADRTAQEVTDTNQISEEVDASNPEQLINAANTPSDETLNLSDENSSVASENKSSRETGSSANISPVPAIEFEASVTSGCAPLEVRFLNQSKHVKSFTWEFGDGKKSDALNPQHTYYAPGVYEAVLRDKNNTLVRRQKIEVFEKPLANAAIDKAKSVFNEKQVKFENRSENATKYTWLPGDNQIINEVHPTYTYKNYGVYEVVLIAENEHGCADTTSISNEYLKANCTLSFPASFVPKTFEPGNGWYQAERYKNAVFFPLHEGVEEYNLKVYNPIGQVIFTSDTVAFGWNGYYRNRLVPPDKYVWEVSGSYITGEEFHYRGKVNVIIDKSGFDNSY